MAPLEADIEDMKGRWVDWMRSYCLAGVDSCMVREAVVVTVVLV